MQGRGPEISAITFVVSDMAVSVAFYETAGMTIAYGGPDRPFTTMRLGGATHPNAANFVNLMLADADAVDRTGFWGRVVLHVDSPDEQWRIFADAGYESLTAPADAPWGERYFHIRDPDGHELSFAIPTA